jgi:hypothetical protein
VASQSTAGDQKPLGKCYGLQVLDNTVTADVKECQKVHTMESAMSGTANQRMTKQTQSKLYTCVTVIVQVVANQNLIPNVSTAFMTGQVVML